MTDHHTTPNGDATDVAGSLRRRVDRRDLIVSLLELVSAVALVLTVILSPQRPADVLARAAGAILIAASALGLLAQASAGLRDKRRVVLHVAGLVVGIWLALGGLSRLPAPEFLLEVIVTVALLLVAVSGVLRVALRFGLTHIESREDDDSPWLLLRWIDAKSRVDQNRDAIQREVYFEGDDAPTRIGRFALMMLFASVIAAAGVIADSTAVVIGAMLIAPLITPMMGMGLALVSGWPNRLGRSTLMMLFGFTIATSIGWLLAAAGDFTVDLDANSQITSRSSPTAIDLIIAVAAGAAGAYALSRKDVSSSLPGVAVSIALVPPLCVVGITAQGGDWRQAAGTLVLFITNLVAIVLAGGVVFVLTGVVRRRQAAENQFRVRTAGLAICALAIVTVGVLVINGQQITRDALDRDRARGVVVDWLGDDSEFSIVTVAIEDGTAAVLLAGPNEPPDAEALADLLAERLDRDVEVDLQWIPRQQIRATSAD